MGEHQWSPTWSRPPGCLDIRSCTHWWATGNRIYINIFEITLIWHVLNVLPGRIYPFGLHLSNFPHSWYVPWRTLYLLSCTDLPAAPMDSAFTGEPLEGTLGCGGDWLSGIGMRLNILTWWLAELAAETYLNHSGKMLPCREHVFVPAFFHLLAGFQEAYLSSLQPEHFRTANGSSCRFSVQYNYM